jgi:cytochrome c
VEDLMGKRAFLLIAVLSAALTVNAGERGTPAEARTMLQKAVAHYTAAGRTQALADFNAKNAPFGDRDLYVFCLGADHRIVANGGFRSYVGLPLDVLKDAQGKSLGKAMWDLASSKGEGSIEYQFLNPVSRKTEAKVSFVKKVGDDVCGVGAYNPNR